MKSRSFVLVCVFAWLAVMLTGCLSAIQPQPFHRAANSGIKKIAFLRVSEPEKYRVNNIDGIGFAFGAIGALVEVAADVTKTNNFTEKMKAQGLMLGESLTTAIEAELKKCGYTVALLDERPGVVDGEPDYSRILTDADAILDVRFPVAGYLSAEGSTNYRPWIRVDARLVSVTGRQQLYFQAFSYGADTTVGEHFTEDPRFAYGDFEALMANPVDSAEGLSAAIGPIATRIGEQLR